MPLPAIPAGDVQAERPWLGAGALARTNLGAVIAKMPFGIARRERGFSSPAKPRRIDGDAPAAVTLSSPAVLNTIATGANCIGSTAGAATRLFDNP